MSEPKTKRPPRAAASTVAAPAKPAAVESATPAPVEAAPETAPVAMLPVSVPEPVRQAAAESSRDLFELGHQALTAFTESQAAVTRGFEAMAVEMAGLARTGIAAAADSATALLGARTLADAFEVNVDYARRSVDAAIAGSAKLSEIGVKLTVDATRPILSKLDESWSSSRFGPHNQYKGA